MILGVTFVSHFFYTLSVCMQLHIQFQLAKPPLLMPILPRTSARSYVATILLSRHSDVLRW